MVATPFAGSSGSALRPIKEPEGWRISFQAMSSPCEVLADVASEVAARKIAEQVAKEAWRIEAKYSRYRSDNLVHAINSAQGAAIEVDAETADLLDFANHCYALSEGRFDITSGVLRELWIFDGGSRLPRPEQVARLLPRIGWQRATWQRPVLRLPPGMEIDFGGIGKEYAVDRIVEQLRSNETASVLVNLGGDLRLTSPRSDGASWRIGVADPHGRLNDAGMVLELRQGALATSGNSRRFVLRNGERLGHILDPSSGNPIEGAPSSVTVAADNCSIAGILATIAVLNGSEAAQFLDQQGVRYWLIP